MSRKNPIDRPLFEGTDAQREQLLVRFEDLWRTNATPSLDEFIEQAAGQENQLDELAFLLELIHIDLEYGVKSGRGQRVESYLERFPQIAEDDEHVVSLIAAEFELLQAAGQTVSIADYQRRFSHVRDQLAVKLKGLPGVKPPPLQVICPTCGNDVTSEADRDDTTIHCEQCGSTIREEVDNTLSWQDENLPQVGRFQLLRTVGRGAFGTVYRARDTELDRIVAVKVPRSGSFATEAEERRFIREGKSTARLQHPNIVPVFEVGRFEDLPYIVTDFVDGVTLADALTGRRFSFDEAVQIVIDVADALQHAHESDVIHRDIKPSNVMLKANDEVRIMDFGLAKRSTGEGTVTLDGQLLGTPAYMSPEQARGEGHDADLRTDIYSLGVVFFELLTGQRPFRGNSNMLMHQVVHGEAPSPRRFVKEVPVDLETICLKCLQRDPGARFQTAAELVDELRRFQRGEPILSRPTSLLVRNWRAVRRNPTLVIMFFVALLSAGASFWVSSLWSPSNGDDNEDPGVVVPFVVDEDDDDDDSQLQQVMLQASQQLQHLMQPGNPEYDAAVGRLSARVAEFLKGKDESASIAAGSLAGQPQLSDNCGYELRKQLQQQLKSLDVRCSRRSEYSFKGDYAFDADERCVFITVRLLNGSKEVKELTERIGPLPSSEVEHLLLFFEMLDDEPANEG